MNDIEKFLILLNQIQENDLHNNLSLEVIENEWWIAKDIVRNGISFDDKGTCYYGYSSIDEMAFCIISDSIIYNMLYKNNQIGLISISNYDDKEDELEIAICIDKDYRNLNIGSTAMKYALDECFYNGAKKVHAIIRVDNLASNKIAEKFNFKKYCDSYKEDFVTKSGKIIKQNHYVLLKKENQS